LGRKAHHFSNSQTRVIGNCAASSARQVSLYGSCGVAYILNRVPALFSSSR
jgi:hypothetical protein